MSIIETHPGDEKPSIDDELFAESKLCQAHAAWSETDPQQIAGLDELAIGLMAFELQDYPAAATALMRVGDDELPQFALAQEWLGVTQLRAGRPELAVEPLRRALQLDEQLGRDPLSIAECRFSLGLAYARTGHGECALREFRDALRHEPEWGTVLFEIARVHAHRNRIAGSVAALAEATRQDGFFLARAQHDLDFDTVRQSPEFKRLAADFENVSNDNELGITQSAAGC